MRYIFLFVIACFCLPLQGQQALIVTTAGDSLMIEYAKIRAVTAPTRTARASIQYDLTYTRYDIRQSFGAFTATADCHLFSFLDVNTQKWTAVPMQSIDRVKKKNNASNGYVFSEIENAREDLVFEFTDTFKDVVDTLRACAGNLSGTFAGVTTDMSVTGNGTGSAITLVNDEETPANEYYYGTDSTGTKGWYPLPVGGGGGSWYLVNGDTMNVAAGDYVTITDSGLIQITLDTITGTLSFYVPPTNFGSGNNGDIGIWNADTLTGETPVHFIWRHNLSYGDGLAGGLAKWLNDSTLTTETSAHFIWNNNLAYGQGLVSTMAYWVNDTTLANSAITYSATQWNASALTGSLRLATGTTAQRPSPVNGDLRYNTSLGDMEFYTNQWRSVPEAMAGTFTAGEIGYFNSAGILTDTTIDALLSIGGAPTGNGVANRVAYWSGANTLTSHANFLWDGSQLSVGTTNSDYTLDVGTGGVRYAPQSAAITGAAGAGYYDSDDNWYLGHNGTGFFFYARSDDVDPGAGRVWFQNAANTAQSTDAGITYDAAGDDLTVVDRITGAQFYTAVTAGQGFNFGTSAVSILATATGGTATKINVNLHSGGNEGNIVFQEAGGTDRAMIGMYNASTGAVTGVFSNRFSGLADGGSVTYTAGNNSPSGAGGSTTVSAGSGQNDNNAGNLILQAGQIISGPSTTGGNPGSIFIKTYRDSDSLNHNATLRTHMIFSSDYGSRATTQIVNRLATTTGTQVLTMEGDTLKYRIENFGAISTSTDGSGDVTVTHGMGTTPTAVLVTPTGTTAWIVSVHTIGATTFKVRFFDAAGAAVTSTAVTATWLGKT